MPVKPNAIKAWRDGEVLSGAKSDAGDAAVIAEYLRLRAHKLKAAAPYSDQTRALRTVVCTRGDVVDMRVVGRRRRLVSASESTTGEYPGPATAGR